jgi:hypothetical protein
VRLLANDAVTDQEAKDRALNRSVQLLRRFCSDEVFAALPKKHQALALLLQQERADLAVSFHRADGALASSTRVTDVSWADGALQLELLTSWHGKDPAAPGFVLDSDRVLRVVEPQVRAALPPELLDYTDDLDQLRVELAVRSRGGYISWQLPYVGDTPRFETLESIGLSLLRSGRVVFAPEAARLGRPVDDMVWDLRTRTYLGGMGRAGGLGYPGPPRPWLVNGRAAVAYANRSEELTVDLAGTLRTFAVDAAPKGAAGPVAAIRAPLRNATAFGAADLPANLVAIADDVDSAAVGEHVLESLAEIGDLHARVVADADGVRLVGGRDLIPGGYIIYARRDGKLQRTRARLKVDADGLATIA